MRASRSASIAGFRLLAQYAIALGLSRSSSGVYGGGMTTESSTQPPVSSPLQRAWAWALGVIQRPNFEPPTWVPETRRVTMTLALCIVMGSVFLVGMRTKDSAVYNTNVGSRYGTVEGLVNHGTFAITKTRYVRTIDKVKYKDDYYSSKPPLLPTATAGVYWVWRAISGYDIRTDEQKVVRLTNTVMGAFLHLLLLIFWMRFLFLITSRPEVVLLGVAAMGFGYLGVGYAIELNNHSPAGTLTLIGFYYAFRLRNEIDVTRRHWVTCGLILGILPGVDLPSLATTTMLGLYLASKDWKQTLMWWLPFVLPGIALSMMLNYLAADSIKPVYLRRELYDYPGSYWKNPRGIDDLREPKHIYGFHLLLGHHGLFSMTPVLFASLIGLYRAWRKRLIDGPLGNRDLRAEALVVMAVVGAMLYFYIFKTRNYGGNCVGFRWSIGFTPLLFFFFGVWLSSCRVRLQHVLFVGASIAFTMIHIWDIFWTPWHVGRWNRWVDAALKGIIG
jgi:hypothetical protein